MLRNTALAEALVAATAAAINEQGKHAPWMARQVVRLVTQTKVGTIREDDVHVFARFKTRQKISKELQYSCQS